MWAPPGWSADLVLTDDGKVQYACGPVHGSWHEIRDEDEFHIKFHYLGDESKAKVHQYKRIEGTHAWQLYWKDRGAVPQHQLVLLLAVLPTTQ